MTLDEKLDAAFGTQAELDAVCRALPKRSEPGRPPLDVLLAERFGSKPVRPNLLELVDQLVDASLLGLTADEGSNAEQVYADKCEELHQEIERRIDEMGGGL